VLVLAKDRTVHHYKMVAATDPLTDVLNRRGFFEACVEIMGNRRLSKEPVSVLAFDLDHFKKINDTHGHQTGDATLHLFASVVKKTLRAGDAIGRLGGEEFLALLPANLAEANIAAERVRKAFEKASELPGKHATATVSIGIASGSPSAKIDDLISCADTALYKAKANGRNRVEAAEEAVAGAPVIAGGPPQQKPIKIPETLAVPLVNSLRGVRVTT
jgi:diguanylate cyclase (GGDEF)-like protein